MVESGAQQKPALRKPNFVTVSQIGPGDRVTLHARVDSVKVVSERVSYDGQSVRRSAQCVIGDNTGSVVLVANDEQLNVVQQGAVITVRNAHARVF